ncbi:MAG: HDOD domain-containing protein [Burkholderiaceae bacterium]|nr:HDOD domain-containing protein [Burkholderiaceae bacterium]
MIFVVLALAVVVAFAAAWWLLPRQAVPASAARPRPALPAARPAAPATQQPPTAVPDPQPLPARLAAFRPLALGELTAQRQQRLADELRRIPRPPSALRQLTSPAFLEQASSAQLSELIMAEAHVAAKVLATVNAPFYGLRQPVHSVGQAVTFLGLNTVRGLCLQALMTASFEPGNAELRRQFDTIAQASALASELCVRLSARLGLPAQGALVTQVVLSFLGPMAGAAMMSRANCRWTLADDLLARSEAEQAQLGLRASALGGLLLQLWDLPAVIVDDVAAIDAVLVTPAGPQASARQAPAALGYLCARLGERLATGGLTDLDSCDPASDDSEAFFHLKSHLQLPALARLTEHLHAADLGRAVASLARGVTR